MHCVGKTQVSECCSRWNCWHTCTVPKALTQSTLDVFCDISAILHQTYGTRDSFPLLLNTLEEELCPHTQS